MPSSSTSGEKIALITAGVFNGSGKALRTNNGVVVTSTLTTSAASTKLSDISNATSLI